MRKLSIFTWLSVVLASSTAMAKVEQTTSTAPVAPSVGLEVRDGMRALGRVPAAPRVLDPMISPDYSHEVAREHAARQAEIQREMAEQERREQARRAAAVATRQELLDILDLLRHDGRVPYGIRALLDTPAQRQQFLTKVPTGLRTCITNYLFEAQEAQQINAAQFARFISVLAD